MWRYLPWQNIGPALHKFPELEIDMKKNWTRKSTFQKPQKCHEGEHITFFDFLTEMENNFSRPEIDNIWYVVPHLYVNLCEFLWFFVNLCEFMWIHVNLCKFMWIHVNLCEFMWIYENLCELMWIYVNLCEFMWIYVNSCEVMWIDVKLCEFMWI